VNRVVYVHRSNILAEHKTIAVVDNNLHILQCLDLLLSSCGYHSKLFASAEEFLSAAPTVGAACLIVDIQLGNVSGLQLVRTLSAQGFALPVIFITASWNELHRREAMELGCAAFFLKPFSPERLIEAVAKAIGSNQ